MGKAGVGFIPGIGEMPISNKNEIITGVNRARQRRICCFLYIL